MMPLMEPMFEMPGQAGARDLSRTSLMAWGLALVGDIWEEGRFMMNDPLYDDDGDDNDDESKGHFPK